MKPFFTIVRSLAAFALLSLFATSAGASLIGSNVGCGIAPGFWSCSPTSATVIDPGVEFQLQLGGPGLRFDVDFDADSMTITWLTGGLGMGAGEVATFTNILASGINGFSTSGTTNFVAGDVSLVAGTLTLLLNGSHWQQGGSATIEFDVVPEPASLALLGAAFAAAVGASRRRSK